MIDMFIFLLDINTYHLLALLCSEC